MLPISTNEIIGAVCSCETYTCNVAIGPNNRTGKSFEYRQQEWANGSITTDWIVLCK
nr:MAG TPA: Recombination and DNA repair protein domain, DNA repair, Cell [Caudoviricetes sp.]